MEAVSSSFSFKRADDEAELRHHTKPIRESTANAPPTENHSSPRCPSRHRWCGICHGNAEFGDAVLAAGVEPLLAPPTRDFQKDGGRTFAEALKIVGTAQAPAFARDLLERAGLHFRCVADRPNGRRWVRYLFSDAGVERLLEQMAHGTFPYAAPEDRFDMHTSQNPPHREHDSTENGVEP